MKKIILSLMTASMLLVGCGKSNKDDSSSNNTTTEELGTILIDPGHGAKNKSGIIDNGATSPDGEYIEGEINYKAAKYLGAYLETKGVTVVYTREEVSDLEETEYTNDAGVAQYNDLRARAEMGPSVNADYFVSLHCDNIVGSGQKSGYHIYYHKDYIDSKELATSIHSALKDAGYKPQSEELATDATGGEYRVIRLNQVPAILIEMGFLNGSDIDYLTDDEKLEAFIKVVGDGIVSKMKAGKSDPDAKFTIQPDI